jgi:hypothetical protein
MSTAGGSFEEIANEMYDEALEALLQLELRMKTRRKTAACYPAWIFPA